MPSRPKIPDSTRANLLHQNQHACCICGNAGVQIHHINGDPTDNKISNLAVLCLPHHSQATSGSGGLAALLKAADILSYKHRWEDACKDRLSKGARACNAFFMVDYKNAERIRHIFGQLTTTEYRQAFDHLVYELREEDKLRQEQGFYNSLEPDLRWSEYLENLLPSIEKGEVHPGIFEGLQGHPRDPLFPCGSAGCDIRIPIYDIWCQLMVRAIISVRTPFLLSELIKLEDPLNSGLSGCLVAFYGDLNGDVSPPDDWEETPITITTLKVSDNTTDFVTKLSLKTHYVYSLTAATSLGSGRGSGLLFLRDFIKEEVIDGRRIVQFNSTPLIIGSGGGRLLEIP